MKDNEMIKKVLKFLDELYSFDGKIGRVFYVTRLLTLLFVMIPLSLLLVSFFAYFKSLALLGMLFGFMLYGLHIYGMFGLHARRMKDIGWNPAWLWLWPFLGLFLLVLLLLKPGKKEE